jgi:hypothetical protein
MPLPSVATSDATARPRWGAARVAVSLLAVLTLIAVGALFVRNASSRDLPWINHDVAYLSMAAQEIVNGAALYVDFDEVNPPGAAFLFAGELMIARMAGAPYFAVVHGFVLFLGACGLMVLSHSLRNKEDDLAFVLIALAYVLVVVRGNFANNVVPAAPWIPFDFGQREHLFVLPFVPYVIWRVRSARVSPWMLPYLVILGYTASFKPYWPVLVGAVELWRLLRDGRRSPGVWAALLGGMGLPFLILLASSPAGFKAFFWGVLPRMIGGIYAYYELTPGNFFLTDFHFRMVLGMAVFAALWVACYVDRKVERSTLWLLLALEATAYLSFVHQGKFWSYHAMVVFATTVVFGALMAAAIARGAPRRKGGFTLAAVGACVLAAWVGVSIVELDRMLEGYPPKGSALVPLLRDETSVMFLSTAGDYAYAPVRLGLPMFGPWGEHYRIAPLAVVDDPSRRRAVLEDYAREVRRRIESERPEVLVFAPFRHGLPPGFSLHDLLVSHGALPEGQYRRVPDSLLGTYHPALRGWVVYRRAADPQEEP